MAISTIPLVAKTPPKLSAEFLITEDELEEGFDQGFGPFVLHNSDRLTRLFINDLLQDNDDQRDELIDEVIENQIWFLLQLVARFNECFLTTEPRIMFPSLQFVLDSSSDHTRLNEFIQRFVNYLINGSV